MEYQLTTTPKAAIVRVFLVNVPQAGVVSVTDIEATSLDETENGLALKRGEVIVAHFICYAGWSNLGQGSTRI